MKNYEIKYYNKTADIKDTLKIKAKSINHAILALRQKRFKFEIETVIVN